MEGQMHSSPLTPLTPLHTRKSSQDSITRSYRSQYRRRTNSFSSNHDKSPTTPKSQHRFSNASAYSSRLSTLEDEFVGGVENDKGLGNLADELDQLDDEEIYEDEDISGMGKASQEIIRDSGVDVSYTDASGHLQDQGHNRGDDMFSPGFDIVIDDITRLVAAFNNDGTSDITSFRKALLHMESLTSLEIGIQRLNTSTNSVAAYLSKESKTLQMLGVSLFSPFGLRDILDYEALEDSLPLIEALLFDLPQPAPTFLQDLQKLSHETEVVIQTNLSVLDTAQSYKQPYETASRHLRTAREKLAEIRHEQDICDLARLELSQNRLHSVGGRSAASQCKEIVDGFDRFCEGIRPTWSLTAEAIG